MNRTSEIRTENKLNPIYMVVIGGTVTTAGLELTVLSSAVHLRGGGGVLPPPHMSPQAHDTIVLIVAVLTKGCPLMWTCPVVAALHPTPG